MCERVWLLCYHPLRFKVLRQAADGHTCELLTQNHLGDVVAFEMVCQRIIRNQNIKITPM